MTGSAHGFRLTLLLAALLGTASPASADTSTFQFENWAGPAIPVRLYLPPDVDARTPVVIVMHGASRDAPRYFEDWTRAAEARRFIVAVPEFTEAEFPGAAAYNLGNVFDADSGVPLPESQWSFSVIEPLFDEIAARTGGTSDGYTLYGHSAGAQFIHRFLYFVRDNRVKRAIVANAGWYTMPDFGVEYPYGLHDSGLLPEILGSVLRIDVLVLLGEADNDPDGDKLRKTPEAELQGPHRLARGQTFYRVAQARARTMNNEFNWQMVFVPGAAHSNAAMTPAAAEFVR